MNFDIEALSIVLNTNIPDAKYKSIKFTRKLLYDPLDKKDQSTLILNDYPYFTHDVKYPDSNLLKLSYKERVNFFFNLDRFNELLTPYINDKLDGSVKDDKYYEKRSQNIKDNINIMLLLLFPTKYPMINELSDSLNYVISPTKNKKKTYGFLYNPFAAQLYSYLDIGGKKYTTKSVVWLNDIMNHPTYNEFLREYRDFYNISSEEEFKTEQAIKERLDQLIIYINAALSMINSVKTTDNLSLYTKKIILYLKKISVNLGIDVIKDDGLFKNVDVEKEFFNKVDEYKMILKRIKEIKSNDPDFISWSIINSGDNASSETKKKNAEIKEIIKKILNLDLGKYIERYSLLKSFSTANYKELNSVSNDEVIRKFYIVLRRMRGVYLQTSNKKLQNLIDLEDKKDILMFHDLMKTISKYMRNEKDSKLKQPELLDVGLSFINLSVSDNRKTPRREIYIMIDLIEGIIDDKNWQKINCSFLNEYLGNEFETLARSWNILDFNSFNKVRTNDWRIDKNRMLYSIEKALFNGANDAIKKEIPNAVNFNKMPDMKTGLSGNNEVSSGENIFKFKNNEEAKEDVNLDTLTSDFLGAVWEKGKTTNSKKTGDKTLPQRIDSFNDNSKRYKGGENEIIDQQNLLKFLIKINPELKTLLLYKGNSTYDKLKILRGLSSKNTYNLELINDKFREKDQTQADQNTLYKLYYDQALYLLFDKVYDLIAQNLTEERELNNERSDQISQSGGKITKKKLYPLNKTHKIFK
jgi:hypothetical protein